MLQRRRPGSQDSRTFEIAIENMDKTDCFAIAADLFYITRKTSNQDILDYDYTPLIVIKKISINLGLNERFQQVLSSFVELYAKNDLLHPYVSEEDKVDEDSFKSSVMCRRNALNKKIRENFSFEEDKTISESEDFLGLEEDFLNFLRILLTKKYNTYSQVIYYTFFSKAKVSLSVFPEKLSEGFNKKMHDISKVKFIQKELKLSDKEAEYLLCRYRKGTIEYVNNLFNRYTQNSEQLYSKLLNISSKEFKHITRPDSKIRQFGFINSQKDLNPAIIDCIEAGDLSLYFADCIKVQELSQVYGLSSFAVPKQNTDIYKTLLKSENSISMLLYGAPGSGKTEYAKALIKSTGKKALIFKNEAELLDKNDVLCRLNCLLSLNRKDSILIIDEADSLLSTCVQTLFGPVQSTQKKGLVNKMLEASQNKVIWIVNYKSQIDESTLRRFTVSYKFAPMTTSMLESIAINKLNCLEIEADTKKEIISLLSQYKVTGASVDNLITTVNSMHSIDKDMDKDKLLENIKIILKDNSTLLHGDPKMRKNVKDTYDMSVLNTSLPAEKIVKMLQNAQKYAEKNPGSGSVKILLYGLSGTGKTEFSRYLGQCLGKDLLLKRASDIFDKYVGG
nr:AAA family ATPase [Treponema sp.]